MFPVQEKLTFQLKPGRKNGELVLNKTMLDRLSEMMVSVCTRAQSFLCNSCTMDINGVLDLYSVTTLHTLDLYSVTLHTHTYHTPHTTHTHIDQAGNQFRGQVHIPGGAREIASHNFGFDISRRKSILVTFSVLSNVHNFILPVYNYMYARHF